MLRFAKNRWWTFILTLSLCCAPAVMHPRAAMSSDGTMIDGGMGSDPGGGATAGDPDLPSGGGNKTIRRGSMQRAALVSDRRTVGDGSATSVWMSRLQFVLYSLRNWYLRF